MELLAVNIKSLRFFLLWPDVEFKYQYYWKTFLLVLFISVNGNPVTAALIYQLFHKCEDLAVLLEAIIGLGDYFGFLFVYLNFHWNFKTIQCVIKDLNQFYKFCDAKNMETVEIKVRFYTKWALIYFLVGVLINSVVPLFDRTECNRRRLSDFYRKRDPCGMSIRNLYPFDANGTFVFPIVFIGQMLCCYCISSGVLVITMCIISLLIHITNQLENCRKMLENCLTMNQLDFCIEYHLAILEYSQRFANTFRTLLFFYIALPSFVVSVLAYQILLSDNVNDKIRYVLHFLGWCGLLFSTCYYGQKLTDESESIANAVYRSEWYRSSCEMQKKIVIVLIRSQKPVFLMATSLAEMSFATFVNVMKNAYSYFTLLLAVTEV